MTQENTVELADNQVPATESVTEESGNSDKSVPKAEIRDGKLFVDGVRVYTRDDTNKIAASAARELESKLLADLKVDSIDQIRDVITKLQGSPEGLNVETLRDAVKKREQSIEELKAELKAVKTQSILKEHLGALQSVMPATWSPEQKSAVVDLMKSRDMFVLDSDTFAIRHGDGYLTDDSGSAPDYQAAVQLMAKTLGLPLAKTGVSTLETDRAPTERRAPTQVNSTRLSSDPLYRQAYVQVRDQNRSLSHAQITHEMIQKQMDTQERGSGQSRALQGNPQTKPQSQKRR